ncbi:MAG TPA: PspC domain-containing protein [Streptosporangiaceae bacterium]|nr:PspC domain-containing protein [Streptosporangiaceae bacterium]
MNTPADTTQATQTQAGQADQTDQTDAADRDTSAGRETRPGYFGSRQLCRPLNGRMLGGVAAGIADYLDVDVTIVRIVFAVLTFIGGAGVPVYLAGWLLIPEEGSDQSLASDIVASLSRSFSAR